MTTTTEPFELIPGSLYADVCLGSPEAIATLPTWLEPAGPAAAPNWARCIYVVYKTAGEAHKALKCRKQRKLLRDSRIAWIGGEDELGKLSKLLRENPSLPVPQVGLGCDSAVTDVFHRAYHTRNAMFLQIMHENDHSFGEAHTRSTLDVLEGRESRPLRFAFVTSIHTSVLRYQTTALATACAALGHEARVLIEKEPHERMHAISLAAIVRSYKPDVIWFIDLNRPQYGDPPQAISCVNWIQDNMPRLADLDAIKRLGSHDFTYAVMQSFVDKFRQLGYPHCKLLLFPVDVSVYKPTPLVIPGRSVALPSNLVEWQENPATPGMVEWMRKRLDELKEIPLDETFAANLVLEACKALGISVDGMGNELHSDINRSVWFQIRETNLVRKARMIRDAGISLALYGLGWDKYPDLIRYHHGVIMNGANLCRMYQSHAAIVHFGQTGFHPRLLEATASGSLVLARSGESNELEIVTHDDDAQLISNCMRAIADPVWRAERIARSRARVLKHTFEARLSYVLDDIRKHLRRECAGLDDREKKAW